MSCFRLYRLLGIGVLAAVLLGGCSPAMGYVQPQPADTASLESLGTQKLFVRGMTQSYLQDYEEAVSLFERALDRAPNEPAILSALADAEAGRDNLTSALYYARKARTQAPDTAYYHEELARLLQAADRPDDALGAYRTLLSRFPNHRDAHLAAARLYKKQDRPKKALHHYEALVERDDATVPVSAYTEMIPLYQETGNETGLERTLKALLARRDTPRYRRLLGQLYVRQHRYRKALPLFESLRDETPNDPRILSQLKLLYQKTNQPKKARTLGLPAQTGTPSPDQLVAQSRSLYETAAPDSTARILDLLQQALDQSPSHVGALDLMGQVYADRGNHADAASAFERALDANPRSPTRWRRTASAYLKADSLNEAAALAEEGALLFPGRSDLARIEAFARLRQGNFSRAKTDFQNALSCLDTTTTSARKRARLHSGLARTLHHLGAFADATAAHERAAQLAPNDPTVLHSYARHLAARDTALGTALEVAQRAVEHAPSSASALGTLGWIYAKSGRHPEAVDAFENALATGQATPWIYEQFGDLQHALGNETRARRYWKRALRGAPERDSLKQKLQSRSRGILPERKKTERFTLAKMPPPPSG